MSFFIGGSNIVQLLALLLATYRLRLEMGKGEGRRCLQGVMLRMNAKQKMITKSNESGRCVRDMRFGLFYVHERVVRRVC